MARMDEHVTTPAQAQVAIVTAGQRRINLIWEITQAFIAISVVSTNLAVAIHAAFHNTAVEIPTMLGNVLFLVVGFYFGRTNHSRMGGIAPDGHRDYQEQR